MIKKVDHIGIAVSSLKEAIPFYTDLLQLELIGMEEVESQKIRVAFIKAGETKLELLEPTSEESLIAKFIVKHGQGIHHIAFGVNSIEERINELKTNGVRMIDEQPRIGAGGASIAFIHPKSTGSVLLELCE